MLATVLWLWLVSESECSRQWEDVLTVSSSSALYTLTWPHWSPAPSLPYLTLLQHFIQQHLMIRFRFKTIEILQYLKLRRLFWSNWSATHGYSLFCYPQPCSDTAPHPPVPSLRSSDNRQTELKVNLTRQRLRGHYLSKQRNSVQMVDGG